MASLLRLADADLKDAELLESGRHPGNAPALLHLAAERLVQAVLATERGWPLVGPAADPARIPGENPVRGVMATLVASCRTEGPPAVSDDGSPPAAPDTQELRAKILAARGVLKDLAARFEVDLFGRGVAGSVAPLRPEVVPQPPAERPRPAAAAVRPARQRVASPATPPRETVEAPPRPTRVSGPKLAPALVPEPHEVAGRASIEVKPGSASMASPPFWALMDRWNVPDQAALDLVGHTGGLTKKGTRPRFKLLGEEAALLRGLQEIDDALRPLGLEPGVWLHQPIEAAPFDGAAPLDYLTRSRQQGVQGTLRFLLQHGLRRSMSNSAAPAITTAARRPTSARR